LERYAKKGEGFGVVLLDAVRLETHSTGKTPFIVKGDCVLSMGFLCFFD
jgi:hypothetical protein